MIVGHWCERTNWYNRITRAYAFGNSLIFTLNTNINEHIIFIDDFLAILCLQRGAELSQLRLLNRPSRSHGNVAPTSHAPPATQGLKRKSFVCDAFTINNLIHMGSQHNGGPLASPTGVRSSFPGCHIQSQPARQVACHQ